MSELLRKALEKSRLGLGKVEKYVPKPGEKPWNPEMEGGLAALRRSLAGTGKKKELAAGTAVALVTSPLEAYAGAKAAGEKRRWWGAGAGLAGGAGGGLAGAKLAERLGRLAKLRGKWGTAASVSGALTGGLGGGALAGRAVRKKEMGGLTAGREGMSDLQRFQKIGKLKEFGSYRKNPAEREAAALASVKNEQRSLAGTGILAAGVAGGLGLAGLALRPVVRKEATRDAVKTAVVRVLGSKRRQAAAAQGQQVAAALAKDKRSAANLKASIDAQDIRVKTMKARKAAAKSAWVADTKAKSAKLRATASAYSPGEKEKLRGFLAARRGRKEFENRDNWNRARDASLAGAGLSVAGAAGYGVYKLRGMSNRIEKVDRNISGFGEYMKRQFTTFPTFSKAGKKIAAAAKVAGKKFRIFEANRLAVKEFAEARRNRPLLERVSDGMDSVASYTGAGITGSGAGATTGWILGGKKGAVAGAVLGGAGNLAWRASMSKGINKMRTERDKAKPLSIERFVANDAISAKSSLPTIAGFGATAAAVLLGPKILKKTGEIAKGFHKWKGAKKHDGITPRMKGPKPDNYTDITTIRLGNRKSFSRIGRLKEFAASREHWRTASRPLQTDEAGVPFTGVAAKDRYIKQIRDQDLDRRDANIARAAGAGALAGPLISRRGGIGAKAAMGAAVAGASVLGIRRITESTRDVYGERNRAGKRAESAPAIAGLGAAGILAAKRLKFFAAKGPTPEVPDWAKNKKGGSVAVVGEGAFFKPVAKRIGEKIGWNKDYNRRSAAYEEALRQRYINILKKDPEYYEKKGRGLSDARQVKMLAAKQGLSLGRKAQHALIKARRWARGADMRSEQKAMQQMAGGVNPAIQRSMRRSMMKDNRKMNGMVIGAGIVPPVLATGAGVAATAYYAKKKEFAEKRKEMNPYVMAGLSGGVSGAILGAAPILRRGWTKGGVAASMMKLGAASAGIVGGGAYIGSKIIGAPRDDEGSAFTRRAALGGTMVGAGIGAGMGVIAKSKGLRTGLAALRSKGGVTGALAKYPHKAVRSVQTGIRDGAKEWTPLAALHKAGPIGGTIGGAGIGAAYGLYQGLDEGQQVDSIRNVRKDMKKDVKKFSRKLRGRLKELGHANQPRIWDKRSDGTSGHDHGRYADFIYSQVMNQKVVSKRPDGNYGPTSWTAGQVAKTAYNEGKGIQKWARRIGGLGKDTADVVRGIPRAKDASGRMKQREWEKGWFKNAVGASAGGALTLGSLAVATKTPMGRRHIQPLWQQAIKTKQKYGFSARLLSLKELDAIASEAGWDVRDPRGKSVRVFAPGSKRRSRREKEWYERTDNERKLWAAGLVGALGVGATGAAMVMRAASKGKAMPMAMGEQVKRRRSTHKPFFTKAPSKSPWREPEGVATPAFRGAA
jgi:hypothetical protein